MSKIEVNQISSQCGSTLTIGQSGDTVTLACGATQTGFGRTGTVDWDTTAKTAGFTAVSGTGYFVNTTSGAITVTLPAGSAGSIVSLKDYAGTFQTNNVTITPNGTDKIDGTNGDATISTENAALTLIYADATRGWLNVNDSTNVEGEVFITATGGTITTSGDYKIHTFTSPGTFCVSAGAGPEATVEYVVAAGGGGGATNYAGGGGGGFRFRANPVGNPQSGPGAPLNGPANLPVSIQGYPVTVGAGGVGGAFPGSPGCGSRGSNSIFSTITSTGGGGGSNGSAIPEGPGGSGGGGGNTGSPPTQGTGNTPPVSPPQGQPGGNGINVPGVCNTGGGGGGAVVAGSAGTSPYQGGPGGAGAGITGFGANGECSSCVQYFSGGGGAASQPGRGPSYSVGGLGGGAEGRNTCLGFDNGQAGTANTGGGGGGGVNPGSPTPGGGAGGSGIVIIRYKYQ